MFCDIIIGSFNLCDNIDNLLSFSVLTVDEVANKFLKKTLVLESYILTLRLLASTPLTGCK